MFISINLGVLHTFVETIIIYEPVTKFTFLRKENFMYLRTPLLINGSLSKEIKIYVCLLRMDTVLVFCLTSCVLYFVKSYNSLIFVSLFVTLQFHNIG